MGISSELALVDRLNPEKVVQLLQNETDLQEINEIKPHHLQLISSNTNVTVRNMSENDFITKNYGTEFSLNINTIIGSHYINYTDTAAYRVTTLQVVNIVMKEAAGDLILLFGDIPGLARLDGDILLLNKTDCWTMRDGSTPDTQYIEGDYSWSDKFLLKDGRISKG